MRERGGEGRERGRERKRKRERERGAASVYNIMKKVLGVWYV